MPFIPAYRKFNFTRDTRYEYSYTVDVKSLFSGSSKNESTLYISSIASIIFTNECEGTLELKNVKLSEKADLYDREEDLDILSPELPQSLQFAEALAQFPLRYVTLS